MFGLFSWRRASFGMHLMINFICHYNRGRVRWPFYPLKEFFAIWRESKVSHLTSSVMLPTVWATGAKVCSKWKHFFRSRPPSQEHSRVINWDLLLYLICGFFQLIPKCDIVQKWGGESPKFNVEKNIKNKTETYAGKWEGIL